MHRERTTHEPGKPANEVRSTVPLPKRAANDEAVVGAPAYRAPREPNPIETDTVRVAWPGNEQRRADSEAAVPPRPSSKPE